MEKDIYKDLYVELKWVQNRILEINREKSKLEARREMLVEMESRLRVLLLDYGDFIYETFKLKEENENAR